MFVELKKITNYSEASTHNVILKDRMLLRTIQLFQAIIDAIGIVEKIQLGNRLFQNLCGQILKSVHSFYLSQLVNEVLYAKIKLSIQKAKLDCHGAYDSLIIHKMFGIPGQES